jgi:hypothetical protein
MNPHNDRLVPLAIIALELEIDVATLVQTFGDDVVTDDAGMRAIPVERCREYVARANAARQAEREHIQRQAAECTARADAINAPIHAMVEAIQAQQVGPGTDMPPLAVMIGADRDNWLARASRNKDEMLAGDLHFHRLADDQEAQQ